MNDRKDDDVKMLNDMNPNHALETRTVQEGECLNRHERRKAAALTRRKKEAANEQSNTRN